MTRRRHIETKTKTKMSDNEYGKEKSMIEKNKEFEEEEEEMMMVGVEEDDDEEEIVILENDNLDETDTENESPDKKEEGGGETKEGEKEGSRNGFSWMGSLTKRTFEKAAKAQSQIGELLKMPAQKYKELHEENATLRKRVEELVQGFTIDSDEYRVYLQGDNVTSSVLSIMAGTTVVGTKQDEQLLTISWERKAGDEEDTVWKTLNSSPEVGFIRTSVDDVGHVLRARITPTELFSRLCPAKEPRERKLVSSLSSASLHSLGSSFSDSKVVPESFHSQPCSVICKNASIESNVNSYGEDKTFTLKALDDPVNTTFLRLCREKNVFKATLWTEKGDKSEEEVIYTAEWPKDAIRICVIESSDTGFALVVGKSFAGELFTSTNIERDSIVEFLRYLRSSTGHLATGDCDSFSVSKVLKQRAAILRQKQSMKDSVNEKYRVCDNAYPSVWAALGYKELANEAAQATKGQGVSTVKSFFSPFKSLLMADSSGKKAKQQSPRSQTSGRNSVSFQDEPIAPFDLYEIAGFGDRYDVEINYAQGEGLGITLNRLLVANPGNSKQAFPTNSKVFVVCISSFCSIEFGGDQVSGQLETCGLVRIGDALVAINGETIQPEVTDLVDYQPATLSRVASLVEQARRTDAQDEPSEKPACSITYTFAQSKSAPRSVLSLPNKLNDKYAKQILQLEHELNASARRHEQDEKKIEELENALQEADARVSQAISHCEERLDRQAVRTRNLINVVEDQRKLSDQAVAERVLVAGELALLKEKGRTLARHHQEEVEALRKEIDQVTRQRDDVNVAKVQAEERIANLEASMTNMQDEGKAWVNTLSSKDTALRQFEHELQAAQVKYENSQRLLDNAISERDLIRSGMAGKNQELEAAQAEARNAQKSLEKAHDEADALTSQLRLAAEELEAMKSRIKTVNENHQAEVETIKEQLSIANNLSCARKEALAAAEKRTEDATHARQAAETNLQLERKQREQVELEIKRIEAARRENVLQPNSNGASSNNHSRAQPSSNATPILTEENQRLKAQVKSLRARIQGLSAEVGRVAQLEQVIAEKNELLVAERMEKARRLEAEDELMAYKRALRQFAENAKMQEEAGNGTPWSNRPKIFDSLYKSDMRNSK